MAIIGLPGCQSGVEPPLPISNREVKRTSADNSDPETDCEDRSQPGIFLINKPSGPTSYDVIRAFKKVYPKEKIGHAGTLDPLASGLLIVLLGKACKRQAEFMGLDKEYQAKIVFGLTSDSYDLGGSLKIGNGPELFEKLALLSEPKIEKAISGFGKGYLQTVPAFCAVKTKGVPLYRLARQGRKIDKLPSRRVKIKKIKLLSFTPTVFPQIELIMTVSKGFYVRSLAFDLGVKLGVGAVLAGLVRTQIGPYSLKKAVDLKKILASGG